MRAEKIAQGKLPGQPPISMVVSMDEKKDGTTVLSFHSGYFTIANVTTKAPFSTHSYEDSSIKKTPNGFHAKVGTDQPKNDGGIDWINVAGKINAINLKNANTPIHFFVNNKLVQTGKNISWSKSTQNQQSKQNQQHKNAQGKLPEQPPPKSQTSSASLKQKSPSTQESGAIQMLSNYWPYAAGGIVGLLLLYKFMQ